MPCTTKVHPWTTARVLLIVLPDKYAEQIKIKDVFDISEIKGISRHKKIHAITFQSIAAPNGLIANLYGSIEGKRHDSPMLAKSWLLDHMQLHFVYICNSFLCIWRRSLPFLCTSHLFMVSELREDELFTRYSLVVNFYSLLITRYFLLVTHYFSLVTRSFVLVARYFLLVTRSFLLVTRY